MILGPAVMMILVVSHHLRCLCQSWYCHWNHIHRHIHFHFHRHCRLAHRKFDLNSLIHYRFRPVTNIQHTHKVSSRLVIHRIRRHYIVTP
jgi:hypothetical protein